VCSKGGDARDSPRPLTFPPYLMDLAYGPL
jgi:hypothetical protein